MSILQKKEATFMISKHTNNKFRSEHSFYLKILTRNLITLKKNISKNNETKLPQYSPITNRKKMTTYLIIRILKLPPWETRN